MGTPGMAIGGIPGCILGMGMGMVFRENFPSVKK